MIGFLRICLFLMAPLVGLAAAAVYARGASEHTRVQSEIIAQPSEWVPFSAELKRIHETDGAVFVGHYYTASDGSTRSETGPSFEKITSIGIKNIAQATFYLWSPERGWTSQPMQLPPGGWKPIPTTFNERMTRVSDTVEGFELIKHETAGRVLYKAPQLNLFILTNLVKCKFSDTTTCGTWFFNIRVGEQPAEYFVPPSDVRIDFVDKPGGIVWREGPLQFPK
jgi:hypothetical protein